MASTMKQWIGAVAVGFAVAAIWALPPEGRVDTDAQVISGEQIRANRLASDFRTTAEVYRRLIWADAVVPLVTGSTPPDAALFVHSEQLPAAQKERFVQAVQREIDALEPVDGMRFSFVLLDRTLGRRDGMGIGGYDRTETYTGMAEGHPYCIQLRPVGANRDLAQTVARKLAGVDRVTPTSNSLGICAFYLRHGMPGTKIESWLEEGGVTLGEERGFDARPEMRIRSRSLLGIRWGDLPFNLDRCLSGDAPSCAEVFIAPRGSDDVVTRNMDIVEQSPALWIGFRSAYPGLASDDAYLLTDLEDEFGRDAFQSFWSSEAEVLTAFEEAFGVPAGEWVVSWISQRYEVDRRGPSVAQAATSGSVLLMLLALLFAFSHQRRRTVVA